jgi:hypothetical protein
MIKMTHEEWKAKGRELFGDDALTWRFVCPSCNHVATVADWRDAGATEGGVAFSCIGRWTNAGGDKAFRGKGGPCNYAGGGLFKLNPITVVMPDGVERDVFAFAEAA